MIHVNGRFLVMYFGVALETKVKIGVALFPLIKNYETISAQIKIGVRDDSKMNFGRRGENVLWCKASQTRDEFPYS